MTATLAEVQKWRDAYAPKPPEKPDGLIVSEAALITAGPFPSLHATDFVVYLRSQGSDPKLVDYINDLNREVAWAYGNWHKAQRNGNAPELLADMLNNATTKGDESGRYAFVQKFIRDYAAANGIAIPEPASAAAASAPSWMSHAAAKVEMVEA